MTTLSLRLPDSIHNNAKIFAEREEISINQLAATALAEKLAVLAAEDFIRAHAVRADKDAFAAALASVPDVAPSSADDYVKRRTKR